MKNCLSILIVILMTNLAISQELSYGAGFGTNFSTISSIGFDSASVPKGVGMSIYGFANYKLNKKFSIDGKLGLDKRLVNYNQDGDPARVAISYISLNPMLKIDLGSEEDRGAYFKIGARISTLLGAKDKEFGFDIKNQFSSTPIGANFGFGADFAKFMGIEFIFDYSITDEVKNSNSDRRIITGFLQLNVNIEKLL